MAAPRLEGETQQSGESRGCGGGSPWQPHHEGVQNQRKVPAMALRQGCVPPPAPPHLPVGSTLSGAHPVSRKHTVGELGSVQPAGAQGTGVEDGSPGKLSHPRQRVQGRGHPCSLGETCVLFQCFLEDELNWSLSQMLRAVTPT